jgi:hypothetical protein
VATNPALSNSGNCLLQISILLSEFCGFSLTDSDPDDIIRVFLGFCSFNAFCSDIDCLQYLIRAFCAFSENLPTGMILLVESGIFPDMVEPVIAAVIEVPELSVLADDLVSLYLICAQSTKLTEERLPLAFLCNLIMGPNAHAAGVALSAISTFLMTRDPPNPSFVNQPFFAGFV